MAFPPEFLDELRARLSLADLVGRRVALKKRGREFHGLCPFHKEKTPSFTISEDKGFYHCFGCGAHGDVIGFLMQTEALAFPEAVERLAGEAGLEVPESSPEERAAARRRTDLGEVMESVTAWFEERLRSSEGEGARAYLERRGLAAETIAQFRLGFAPDRRGALTQAMNAKGIGKDLLAEGGLIKPSEDQGPARDYFFNRLIFPISDRRGRVIGFGGRALGESPAKYLNSPDTPLFHKGQILYNLSRARQAAHDSGEVLVTEGYMDVIALTQAGFPAAVAPLGTAITEAQILQLWRLVGEPTLCLDGDSAGRRAAFRALERALPMLKPGCSLKFVTLPPGEDPDSLLRARGPEAMRGLIDRARPMAEVLWQKEAEGQPLDTPERRAGLRQRLFAAVRQIQDEGVRDAYQTHLRDLFDRAYAYQGKAWGSGWGSGRGSGRDGGRGRARRPQTLPLRPLNPNLDPATLRRRQDQVLLGTLVNHPDLLQQEVEELATLEFNDAEYQRFSRALADLICDDPTLDTDRLKGHLSDQGFDGILAAVLSREVYSLWSFVRPDASPSAAREGWLHVLGIRRGRQAAAERYEAERLLAEHPNEENLARIQAKQSLEGAAGAKGTELDWLDSTVPTRSE